MKRAAKTVETRLDLLGHRDSKVLVKGSRLVISVPGRLPRVQLAAVERPGVLEFYDLETSLTGPSVSPAGNAVTSRNLYRLLARADASTERGPPNGYYLFTSNHSKFFGPGPTKSAVLAIAGKSQLPQGWIFVAVPHGTVVVTCSSSEVVCPANLPMQGNVIGPPPTGRAYYYLFAHDPNQKLVDDIKGVPQLTDSDLKGSDTRQDLDPTTNEPVVLMQFTDNGSRKFQRVTAAEYERGRNRDGIPQHFAIVLDGELRSFPQIDPTKSDLAGGISGNAEISGIGSIREAKDLALELQSGPLPVRFIRVR